MALTTSEAGVVVSGEIYVAPTGTAAPSDTSTALNAAFKGLGYYSDDGITENLDRSIDNIVASQNATVVRSVVTEAVISWEFELLQTNKDTIEFAYGTTVTQSVPHGTYTITPGSTGGRKSVVFHHIDGSQIKRIYVAEGEVTERGESVAVSSDVTRYPCTFTAYTAPVVYDTRLKT